MKTKDVKEKKGNEPTEEQILMPGKKFEIRVDGRAVKVFVCPLGLRHLGQFSTTLAGLMGVLVKESDGKEIGGLDKSTLLRVLMPHILTTGIDLFKDCIRIEGAHVDGIPHYEFPPFIEHWIMDSFGERKKWEPWIRMVENLVSRLTGEDLDLLAELSKPSSGRDTLDTTS